jgi:flagellar M-ring protein FliF
MEWIRNWMAQIQAAMSRMALSQKLLIISLLVIGLTALLLIAVWASSPTMASLLDQPLTAGDQGAITSYLTSHDIDYRIQGDQVWVPSERRVEVLAGLQMQKLLPRDTSQGFSVLIEKQSWWQSNEQNRQLYNIALQNELNRIIGKMRGVDEAEVIISRPQSTGFDASYHRPSASVNVVVNSGRVNQDLADSIAGLVSGAVAEMKPEDVTVIDAVAGQPFHVRDQDHMATSDYLELVQAQEKIYHDKIATALGYIPRVIVAVNVELDPKRVQTNATQYNKDTSVTLLTQEHTNTQTSTQRSNAGEPGVRANVGATIPGAEASGNQSSTEESETQYSPFAGVEHTTTLDPGGVPTRVSATINVPRSYFVALYMQGKPADTAAPDDAALQPLYDSNLKRIQDQVTPLLTTRNPGQVVVDVYPDDSTVAGRMVMPSTAAGGPLGMLVSGGILRYAGLGALSLTAVFAMLLMLRKAAHPAPIPTAAEIAGLPHTLETGEGELAGEATEADAALMGIELNEEQIATRKITEQVASMVRNNPSEASRILRQWVKQEV